MGDLGRFFVQVAFPLVSHSSFVTSPSCLRWFSDISSIILRSPNGEWTENERRLNGARTEVERSSNGTRTENERSPNGARTEPERRMNGEWTELERSSNGARTELERSSNGAWTELERRMNGGWTENDRKPNGERTEELTLLAKRSVFLRYDIGMPSELSSAKMERVLASLRAQNYNAKKRNPNFLQICGISKAQNDENTGLISRVFKIHNIFLHDFIEFRRR